MHKERQHESSSSEATASRHPLCRYCHSRQPWCLFWLQPGGWVELPDLQVNPCCLFLRGDNSGVHWLNPSFVYKSTGSSLRSWVIRLVYLSICHWFTNTKYTLWIHTAIFYLSCYQRGQKNSFLFAVYANVSSLMCTKWFLNDSLEIVFFFHYYVNQQVASMHHHRRVCSQ